RIVATGTPDDVAKVKASYTGEALKPVLAARRASKGILTRRVSEGPVPSHEPLREITVQGAQQHNLKNIDVAIPREAMTVCSGPSGSGKSSLALDTIYAEGQRRYIESLSAYARRSEERRVGKGCRSWWWQEQLERKLQRGARADARTGRSSLPTSCSYPRPW